jgi:hypothetical protein
MSIHRLGITGISKEIRRRENYLNDAIFVADTHMPGRTSDIEFSVDCIAPGSR